MSGKDVKNETDAKEIEYPHPDYVGSCEGCGCDLTIWDGYNHGDKDLFCETCVQRADRIYGIFED